MRTRRFLGWGIVVFLLAALPGLTAVMAQGQEPGKQLPVEQGWDWGPECTRNENEPNNTRNSADPVAFGDVICGEMHEVGGPNDCEDYDLDYFKFTLPSARTILLEAHIGLVDLAISLRDQSGHKFAELLYYDDPIYLNLPAGDYYINTGLWYNDAICSSDYSFVLASPLLVSAAAANLGTGTVAGIPFRSEDILAYAPLSNGEDYWQMFFDGSDVGVKTLTNLAWDSGGRILITTGGNQTLPGVGAVTPWDIVIFDPESYGENTAGTFSMGLDGSEHQLTTSGEKLDAIEGFTMGIESDPAYRGCFGYPVSTVGVANVNGPFGAMKQDDEDVFCKVYNPNYGGFQNWDWFFDVNGKFDAPASEPAPGNVRGLAGEDVFAMAYNDNTETMYLTILGSGKIAGHNVTQKDIFAINYPGYTWGGYIWRGPQHGWNYNIDAIELNGW